MICIMYVMTVLWSVWISNDIMYCVCHDVVVVSMDF